MNKKINRKDSVNKVSKSKKHSLENAMEKSKEVMTNLDSFGACGLFALSGIIRKQIETLDWYQNEFSRILRFKEITEYVSKDYSHLLSYELEMSCEDAIIRFTAPHYKVTMDLCDDSFYFSTIDDCRITSYELDLIADIRDCQEEIMKMLFDEDFSYSYAKIKCTKCKAKKCPSEFGEAMVIDVIMKINGDDFVGNRFSWVFKDTDTELDELIKMIEHEYYREYQSENGGRYMARTDEWLLMSILETVKFHNEIFIGKDVLCVEFN